MPGKFEKRKCEFCVRHQEEFQELYSDEWFCESCLVEVSESIFIKEMEASYVD